MTVTPEQIEAGKRAFGDTELVGDDYMGRALGNAFAAMKALNPEVERLREALRKNRRSAVHRRIVAGAAMTSDLVKQVAQAMWAKLSADQWEAGIYDFEQFKTFAEAAIAVIGPEVEKLRGALQEIHDLAGSLLFDIEQVPA